VVETTRVAVVGAGQSGLAASYYLRQHGVEHVVLERGQVANMWATLPWQALRLVTQNWQCRLPGEASSPGDPEEFMDAAQVRDLLQAYAQRHAGEVRAGVEVRAVTRRDGGGYLLQTSTGDLACEAVVVATGTFHAAGIPPLSEQLGDGVQQLHSMEFRRADALADGAALVVGCGQSGWQVARELHQAGRRVFWSLGRGAMLPRRYRGRDIFRWLDELGLLEIQLAQHPGGDRVRDEPRPFFYDLSQRGPSDPRAMAGEGMTLLGRVVRSEPGVLHLADDRDGRLRELDQSSRAMAELVDTFVDLQGLDAPAGLPVVSSHRPPPAPRSLALDAEGIGAIIWATGYRTTWHRWIEADIFDDGGYPREQRGVTALEGLYFVGLTWMHGWGSGLLYGVARDASHVVDHLVRTIR